LHVKLEFSCLLKFVVYPGSRLSHFQLLNVVCQCFSFKPFFIFHLDKQHLV
jgi:hypothetical protein